MMNVGIIGYGYWGPNLVRNFNNLDDARVVAVAENRPERHAIIRRQYPSVHIFSSGEELIDDTGVDAIVVATPVYLHFPLAKRALQQGKHVLIEKPMTSTVSEAEELIGMADQRGLVLMVDHTFLYTGAVTKMKEAIDGKTIGTPLYFDSTRINLGLFQSDVNVLWDLAPHDISMLCHLISEKPFSVNATGISHTHNGIENVAYMTVNYQTNFVAHFNCSWSSPVKVRTTLIGGDKKMILYNDVEPSEKIRIYDTGHEFKTEEDKNRILVDYRTGDIYIPKLSSVEALQGVAKDFIGSIRNASVPLASAALGLQVMRILEASQTSIKERGREVKL
jgi:predicted dehydrogenase